MDVLVDHDNLPAKLQREGPFYLADRVLSRVGGAGWRGQRLDVRVYGGWDSGGALTAKAQVLSAQLASGFPTAFTLDGLPRRVVLTAVLAQSLLVEPTVCLRDTYRLRPPARRLTCFDPRSRGCTAAICPIEGIGGFFAARVCPAANCAIDFDSLVVAHSVQKVVDTAIVADLAFLGQRRREVAVVTSDDDIWPGIAVAMHFGAEVYHVGTSGRGATKYAGGSRALYKHLEI